MVELYSISYLTGLTSTGLVSGGEDMATDGEAGILPLALLQQLLVDPFFSSSNLLIFKVLAGKVRKSK